MNDELLLGIDIGTSNCKALIFDLQGRSIAAASAPTPVTRPRLGWAEHDPQRIWELAVGVIRRALAQVDATRIRGIAVAGMAEAGVLINAHGEPVSPILAWYDARTADLHAAWAARVDPAESFAINGIAPRPIFSLFKLQWLRDNAPAAYTDAVRWLHVPDYIAFRLCGAAATDFSLASRTMLLDLRRRRWSDVLVARAGLRADLLPELVAAGTHIGAVTDEAAATTGLMAGTPVGAGGHDHVCGALAAGVREHGMCLDSMGTAESAFVATAAPLIDELTPEAGVNLGVHVAHDRWYVMRGVSSAGASVNWAGTLLGAGTDAAPHARLEGLAREAPAGSLGVLFVPRITGGDRGAFVGITADADQAALARAVFEGLAYEWRRCLGLLEGALGGPAQSIRLIGGGTRARLWVQIKADVLNRPLQLLALDESVALGAALLGGIAAGLYRDENVALAGLRRDVRIIEADPARAVRYERIYRDAYLPIAPALADIHASLAAHPF